MATLKNASLSKPRHKWGERPEKANYPHSASLKKKKVALLGAPLRRGREVEFTIQKPSELHPMMHSQQQQRIQKLRRLRGL